MTEPVSPVLVLVAELHVDLSPVTRHLWAERIVHRVIEQDGKQCLFLADPAELGKVKEWLEQWQAGELEEPLAPGGHGGAQKKMQELLQTPLSMMLLLVFIAVFVWMHFSGDWQGWLFAGAELWPEHRFDPATYADIGLWALWRPTLLHFSFMHILFNGLWWFILARPIERHDGVMPLLALLLICGLVGNTIQWWYAGPSFGGVSGVTMGMLGWVGLRLRKVPYNVPKMLLPVMVGWTVISIALDTVIPGMSGTAHGAHIGGLIAGFILAAVWPYKHSK